MMCPEFVDLGFLERLFASHYSISRNIYRKAYEKGCFGRKPRMHIALVRCRWLRIGRINLVGGRKPVHALVLALASLSGFPLGADVVNEIRRRLSPRPAPFKPSPAALDGVLKDPTKDLPRSLKMPRPFLVAAPMAGGAARPAPRGKTRRSRIAWQSHYPFPSPGTHANPHTHLKKKKKRVRHKEKCDNIRGDAMTIKNGAGEEEKSTNTTL